LYYFIIAQEHDLIWKLIDFLLVDFTVSDETVVLNY